MSEEEDEARGRLESRVELQEELIKLRAENKTLRAARDGQKRIEKELRAEIVRLRAGVPTDE